MTTNTRGTASAADDRFTNRALSLAAWAYLAGMGVHAIDHLFRGITGSDETASWPGSLQVALSAVAVGLPVATLLFVRTGHRRAPLVATVVGLGSAVVFFTLHVLPSWAPFTDSFIGAEEGARVTPYSWVTAALGIGGASALGLAGAIVLCAAARARRWGEDL